MNILFDSKGTNIVVKPYPLIAAGFYFGILQTALFFTIQVFLTATFIGYFVIVVAWMTGIIINLKYSIPSKLPIALILSIVSFYVFLLVNNLFASSVYFLPLYAFLIFMISSPAGAFFRELGKSIEVSSLFYYENNGFILGILFSTVFFVSRGVNFLYFVPIISFLFICINFSSKFFLSLAILILFSTILLTWGNFISFLSLFVFGVIYFLNNFKKLNSINKYEIKEVQPDFENKAILFISGFNLIILQYFIVRQFSSILSANELTILIVSVIYFLGFSIGYAVSKHITLTNLKILSVVMFFIHIGVFVFIKSTAGYLIASGYNLEAILLLLFIASFCTSAFYSIFLPKIIEIHGAGSLASAYIWDLFGAIIAVVILIFLIGLDIQFIMPIYFILMLILIYMVIERSRWAKSYLLFGFFVIGMLYVSSGTIRKYSTEDYYKSRGYANPEIIFSGNSFYHSVEVIKTYKDSYGVMKNSKASFINGVRYFDYYFDDEIDGETSLSEFTYFLAELPAKYLYNKLNRKLRVLILGGGSMYSINRVSNYSSKTTLVEIDPVIIKSAKECWSEFNNYNNISNYEIIIDDAKHFLRTTDEKYDLIIMDISAPYYLGTALLHNKDFFEIVRSKLKAGGIFSESTQNRPSSYRPNAMGTKILASVASVFPKYTLVDCDSSPRGRRGFIYSSNTMNVDHKLLRSFMNKDDKMAGTHLYNESNNKYDLSKTIPYSLTNMEILFYGNLNRIKSRLRIDERIERGGRFFEKRKTRTSGLKLKLPEMIFRQLNVPINYILFFVVIILGLIIRFIPDSKSK